jgi:hypothetical protein
MLRRLQAADGQLKSPTQHDLDTINGLVYYKYVQLPPLDGKNPMRNYDGEGWLSVYAPLTDVGQAALRDAS